jgi:hypothetical protein
MIVIVVALSVICSMFTATFVSYSPKFQGFMENDFIRRVYNNSMNYSLKYGQLCVRAGTITLDTSKQVTEPLRQRENTPGDWVVQDELKEDINYTLIDDPADTNTPPRKIKGIDITISQDFKAY